MRVDLEVLWKILGDPVSLQGSYFAYPKGPCRYMVYT